MSEIQLEDKLQIQKSNTEFVNLNIHLSNLRKNSK